MSAHHFQSTWQDAVKNCQILYFITKYGGVCKSETFLSPSKIWNRSGRLLMSEVLAARDNKGDYFSSGARRFFSRVFLSSSPAFPYNRAFF